jgi:hypothetical protein
VPRSRHPRPSDARSPFQIRYAPLQVRTPSPRQAGVPFRRFYPVALGVGRTAHPPGKHVPQTADKPKETEPNTMFNKVTFIGRLGQKRRSQNRSEQQSHFHRPPRTKTPKPKPLRTTKSTSSSTSQPRKAGRTTRANTRTAPSGTASSPGGISRSSPRRSRRGSSSPWKASSGIAR